MPLGFIPVCEPTLNEFDSESVAATMSSGWISGNGPRVQELEELFGEYLGVRNAVAVNTGTAAVHLMLLTSGLKPGDEVLVPTFTMAGSIFPLLYAGLVPIFVDADIDTWCMNIDDLRQKVTSRTKAVMVVHIYGYPENMERIRILSEKHGLIVLEDAAEALGSEFHGQKCGTFGKTAAFSLFANKVVSSGEGGIVVTDDENIAEHAKKLRNLAFPTSGERRYIHDEIGFNYRLSNLLAAVGVSQMHRVQELVNLRIKNANYYREKLEYNERIVFQPTLNNIKNSSWMVGIRLTLPKQNVKQIRRDLLAQGIETRPFFKPMHAQVPLRRFHNFENAYPVAELLSETGFYLPSSSHLTKNEIEYISQSLNYLLEKVEI